MWRGVARILTSCQDLDSSGDLGARSEGKNSDWDVILDR